MASQAGGRMAYITRMGHPGERADLVDIFAYAEPKSIGMVQEQQEYQIAWARSLQNRARP